MTKVTPKGNRKKEEKEVVRDRTGEQTGDIWQLGEEGRGREGTRTETCCFLDEEYQQAVHACQATFSFHKPLSLLIAAHAL